ncbi:hypothetical protein VTP01DRAFT_4536 [Rhizomucor pusillus]|uniref:uncharacterized protein n=1 Tax=Rhizomucor pusillus TaxID=4840 RepID=UPI003742C556
MFHHLGRPKLTLEFYEMFLCIRAFSVELHDKEKKKKGRYCTNECMRVESMKEKVVVVDETVEAGENVIQP